MQPYLNELPAELVDAFPQLAAAAASAASASSPTPSASTPTPLGEAYREARVSGLPGEREPFGVDPALIERGLKGHADTENELARVFHDAGIEPRSRRPQEPTFDLAWEKNGSVFVAEIKRMTDENEEGQLRLGLGQVLRNRHRLQALGHEHVVAVLVPERAPRDPSWRELCEELGVALLSRDDFHLASTLGSEATQRSRRDR